MYGGTTLCGPGGVTTAVTFTHNIGDVPGLVVSTAPAALTLASASSPSDVRLEIFNRACGCWVRGAGAVFVCMSAVRASLCIPRRCARRWVGGGGGGVADACALCGWTVCVWLCVCVCVGGGLSVVAFSASARGIGP